MPASEDPSSFSFENLEGSYPYECIDRNDLKPGSIVAVHPRSTTPASAFSTATPACTISPDPHLMNMIEKILARASGQKEVSPGEVVVAKVDRMVMHDLSANFVTRVFREELGGGSIPDPSRIAFVFDHNFSPATREAAEKLFEVRRFAAATVFACSRRQRQPASRDHRERTMGAGAGHHWL